MVERLSFLPQGRRLATRWFVVDDRRELWSLDDGLDLLEGFLDGLWAWALPFC
jgi:hypothetical protein